MVQKPLIFISATSDLHSARDLVGKVLFSMGFEPHWQDIKPIDGGELLAVLRKWLDPCSMVIQLVGQRYGAEPPTPTAELGRVSYTQYEALYAEQIGKKVIYHFIDAAFPKDAVGSESDDLGKLQSAYKQKLIDQNRLRHKISTTDQLELTIHRLRDELAALRELFEARFREQSDQLTRIEKLLVAQQQQNPNATPTLSPEDQRILDEYKQSADSRKRLAASVLQPDEQTDALLAAARQKHLAEGFELAMLEGKRWYFARPLPQPDTAIPFFENALKLRPNSVDAGIYAALAHNSARLGDVAVHQRRAIEICEGTLPLTPPRSAGWAGTQNNLGDAWRDLPTGDRAANLAKAIAAYEAALRVRTRADFPADWATTQNNLGNAWRDLPTGDRAANLAKAIAAYEAALQIRSRADFPDKWAATQNNLGAAWQDLPTGDWAANLAKAIAAYEAALQVYTQADFPAQWATTQNNLGNAWSDFPTADRAANLTRAIAAYEAALQVFTRAEFPVDWAMTQNNLGTAWWILLAGDRAANLAKAIAAYDAALQVRSRADFPADWAGTQNNLGVAWSDLRTGDRAANLAKAIAACEAALQVYTRTDFPEKWALTHYNLALALSDLAKHPGQDRCGLLRRAIASDKAALLVRTPDAFPRDHADTVNSMAIARRAYEAAGCERAMKFDDIPPAQ